MLDLLDESQGLIGIKKRLLILLRSKSLFFFYLFHDLAWAVLAYGLVLFQDCGVSSSPRIDAIISEPGTFALESFFTTSECFRSFSVDTILFAGNIIIKTSIFLTKGTAITKKIILCFLCFSQHVNCLILNMLN